MALIRFAEGQQRSGSIGATVYAHNRFGQYVRARSIPTNPNTSRQQQARLAVKTLTNAWSLTLTQAQRDAWKVYADNVTVLNRLGDPVHLTALNHYIRSNTPRILNGLSRVDDGPSLFNLGDPEGSLTVGASEGTQLISWGFDDSAPWTSEDGAAELVQMGLPQNPGIQFFGSPWRGGGAIPGDATTPPTSPVTLAAPFPFVSGQRIFARVRITRADGRLSTFAQANFLASS